MDAALTTLLNLATPALCPGLPESLDEVDLDSSLREQVTEMLGRRNGFFAFESALRVFPACRGYEFLDVLAWNSPNLWRRYYGDLADGCVFFAEDVFGFQFACKGGLVWSFNSETGELTEVGDSIEGWAAAVLNDFEYQTGYPFARQWQAENRLLLPTERLFPKYPFVLGGKYEIGNLVVSNSVYGMQFRGYVAQQIRDLPEGTRVELVFSPRQ